MELVGTGTCCLCLPAAIMLMPCSHADLKIERDLREPSSSDPPLAPMQQVKQQIVRAAGLFWSLVTNGANNDSLCCHVTHMHADGWCHDRMHTHTPDATSEAALTEQARRPPRYPTHTRMESSVPLVLPVVVLAVKLLTRHASALY